MELSGSHFEYSGTSSRKYDLIFANANTDRLITLAGDIQSVTVFNKFNMSNYYIGNDYSSSPIQFDAEVVTSDLSPIHPQDIRKVEKWLFHQNGYRRLYSDLFDDCTYENSELVEGIEKRMYLNCRFMNPEKIESDWGVVGYKFVVECDSCMAWQDSVSYTFETDHTGTESNSIITVNVDTDLHDYVYPKVTIAMGTSGGDITISNNTDNTSRLTSFVALTPEVVFTMNGNGINYISGENYLKFSNKNFIRLLDGENKVSILGDVKQITFEFQQRRYL